MHEGLCTLALVVADGLRRFVQQSQRRAIPFRESLESPGPAVALRRVRLRFGRRRALNRDRIAAKSGSALLGVPPRATPPWTAVVVALILRASPSWSSYE